MKRTHFFWISGIFDENTINDFPGISSAANFWQRGFAETLKKHGNIVDVFGYPVERVWPFGRLVIDATQASLDKGFKGKTVGYINIPFFRVASQYINYLREIKKYIQETGGGANYVVTYSSISRSNEWTSSSAIARFLSKKYNISWICIVGDGVAPPGADGYVYNTWGYFNGLSSPSPKMFLDGGIPLIDNTLSSEITHEKERKVVMFMGSLGEHAGVTWLANSFHSIKDSSIELWISGKGVNTELQQLVNIDKRIKLMGFVSERELDRLAAKVTVFVNPRPSNFEPNNLNYPSKLLHYFAYEKPVISTITKGLSPEYESVIIPVRKESVSGLANIIVSALSMNLDEYAAVCDRVAEFNATHSWDYKVRRFGAWLETLD